MSAFAFLWTGLGRIGTDWQTSPAKSTVTVSHPPPITITTGQESQKRYKMPYKRPHPRFAVLTCCHGKPLPGPFPLQIRYRRDCSVTITPREKAAVLLQYLAHHVSKSKHVHKPSAPAWWFGWDPPGLSRPGLLDCAVKLRRVDSRHGVRGGVRDVAPWAERGVGASGAGCSWSCGAGPTPGACLGNVLPHGAIYPRRFGVVGPVGRCDFATDRGSPGR